MATVQVRSIRVVRETFIHNENGFPEVVQRGTTVREGHPLLKKFQRFFQPVGYAELDWPTDKDPHNGF